MIIILRSCCLSNNRNTDCYQSPTCYYTPRNMSEIIICYVGSELDLSPWHQHLQVYHLDILSNSWLESSVPREVAEGKWSVLKSESHMFCDCVCWQESPAGLQCKCVWIEGEEVIKEGARGRCLTLAPLHQWPGRAVTQWWSEWEQGPWGGVGRGSLWHELFNVFVNISDVTQGQSKFMVWINFQSWTRGHSETAGRTFMKDFVYVGSDEM